MARLLHGRKLWSAIQRLARQSQKVMAAVGFIGEGVDQLLHWRPGCVLIADLTRERVQEGVSSARGALRLLEKGVAVYSLKDLHAKVLLFDRHAVVGSMNLSQVSHSRLREAGVLLDGDQVKAVQKYLRSLQREAQALSAGQLRELTKLEPLRSGHSETAGPRAPQRASSPAPRRRRENAQGRLDSASSTKAFLFTWNPVGHPNVTYEGWRQAVKGCAPQNPAKFRWSCGVRTDPKKIPERSLAFLVCLGKEVDTKGVVAVGRITGKLFRGKHWKDRNRTCSYVPVEFEHCWEVPRVTVDELRTLWPRINWTPQASGTEIPGDVARELKDLLLGGTRGFRSGVSSSRRQKPTP